MMATLKGVKAKFDRHPQFDVPRHIYDIHARPSRASAKSIAGTFIKKIAKDLKIKTSLSQLKFDKVKETIFGSQALWQQYHEGHQISGAWIKVDIDKEGKVFNVVSDLIPDKVLVAARRKNKTKAVLISADEAKARTLALAEKTKGATATVHETEFVYFPHDGIPTAAWKVLVHIDAPRSPKNKTMEWKVYLDAQTGEVLAKIDLLKKFQAKGKVFDPNPVVTLNDTSLEDTSPIRDAAYSQVTLPGLRSKSGLLDGEFVSTTGTRDRVKRKDLKFIFTRKQRAFKEVMVYFHIDRVQRYIQSLGFANVLNHPIGVNIDGQRDDNSHYSPITKSLTFGTGGVDDAEDAEIILHEYGHAVQDDQVPGWGEAPEGGAMGEGFGDYLAASFFSDVKPAKLKPTIGNWDAVAYSGDDPPCLRRLDSNKKYPKDKTGEVHDDGEIWSACLWEIRGALGRKTTDKLVIAHHVLLSRFAQFKDAVRALIAADKQMNHGANETVIRNIFVRRGILPNTNRKGKFAGQPFE